MSIGEEFVAVTEIAGDEVSQEQIDRIVHRYVWAAKLCRNKDVVEVACGTGQGAGILDGAASTYEAGDYSENLLTYARKHYGDRIIFKHYDAQELPFADASKDVILIFEAIYYIPNVKKFLRECARVLRENGKLLIATANKDLFDFNPSPHSTDYYGVVELDNILNQFGFENKFYGNISVGSISFRQKLLRPLKKMIVRMGLMPKSMAGKKFFKRLVFGKLVMMPPEIYEDMIIYHDPVILDRSKADSNYKVIYCESTKI